MRGHIISALEETYRTSLFQVDYNNIFKLKYEYNSILGSQVSNLLLIKLRQKQFELGDNPVKLLARQLKSAQANRVIHKIRSKAGTWLTDPKIKTTASNNCTQFYSSRSDASGSNASAFFDSISLPKVDDRAKKRIELKFNNSGNNRGNKSFPTWKGCRAGWFGL